MRQDQDDPLLSALVVWRRADDYRPEGEEFNFGWMAPLAFACAGVIVTLLLVGCAAADQKGVPLLPEVRDAVSKPAGAKPAPLPPAVAQALVPPADLAMPNLASRALEPRFDLNVVNLPVTQVFTALAKDTRYSLLVDPELKGNITVNLKDVTLVEALETLRDMFGFEYRVQGTRVFVQPAVLTTRVFQVNYILANRAGRSDVRVTSGSISLSGSGAQPGAGSAAASTAAQQGASGGTGAGGSAQESSRVTTQIRNDLWGELELALKAMVGDKEGRQLILSPQSGVIVVRALPRELRQVEAYLRAARLNVERQVMLEAKIVDVRLTEGFQAGVNWAGFRTTPNSRGSAGLLTPGTTLGNSGNLASDTITAAPGASIGLNGAAASGLFGLAFQTSNFAALLSFLGTQGDVQVLSSPRIAALNNQKAVLKVGTDDFFVTSVSTNIQSATTGGNNIVTPTITVQPFFSGIALDVTPQIDEDGNITLHVHPSVSNVAERNKVLNLGSPGSYTLPLASSSISETDTVVRVRDGHIVAIGGLMKVSASFDKAQIPGAGDAPAIGGLFGSRTRASEKHELVILIKPTVIHSEAQADALRDESLARLESMRR